MTTNSFGARSSLRVGEREYEIYRLDALHAVGVIDDPADTEPFHRILVEHLPERFGLFVILVLGEAVGGRATPPSAPVDSTVPPAAIDRAVTLRWWAMSTSRPTSHALDN